MTYPWLRIVEGNPPTAVISLPPTLQRAETPSIKGRSDSTSGLLSRWTTALSDVICFFAHDAMSARNRLSLWMQECSRLELVFRLAVAVVLDDAGNNVELERLQTLPKEDSSSSFFHSLAVHSVHECSGRLPNSVFDRMKEVPAMRAVRHLLWDWYTMFKLSRGLLRQLTSRSPSPLHKTGINYVTALDLERTPQPLQEANKWLADAWCSWVEQAISEDEVLQMRLLILAHAIAIDTVTLYKGK
ncbi:hypothetical protein CKAH01_16807 [Colletotrichum kahawae]|uniref:Uncharacterized protein n=1 Tax=Colletotrichum kahawae TaxID=34407 RepID=A0AAD9YEZ0_COLKA|nr:hypothetical protein CKAH01_16807 [Colletotrichum kahawae]